MHDKRSGFTIVELLIVIVVIAILAAISIVAYNGMQSRAKDNIRRSDIANIQKAIELYKIENGGYPACYFNGPYQPGTAVQYCNFNSSNVLAALVPKYISSLPADPVNSGQKIYRYGVGYNFTPPCTAPSSQTNTYLIGAALDDTTISACPGFWGQSDVNYVVGTKQ